MKKAVYLLMHKNIGFWNSCLLPEKVITFIIDFCLFRGTDFDPIQSFDKQDFRSQSFHVHGGGNNTIYGGKTALRFPEKERERKKN